MTTPQPPGGGGPYDHPPHATEPADAVGGTPPLAPLGRRLTARTIDIGIVVVIAFLLSLIAYFSDRHDAGLVSFVFSIAALLVAFVYEGLMLTRSRGQTVGKKLMNLRVAVLADGSVPEGSPGWTRAAVWGLPGVIICGCLWWAIDGVWVTWDQPYRQALHDKAAKTVVVEAR
ncbi:RDD family protein [Streptacidiphilus melanogenes]|uniref:RDD family protein n=1 Tax=Streptacidiphilus melanogenes TaxID=411235 RepID=UPI0005A9FE41|nr:RDD family protein [Streptacidiphilus melanogenes]